MRAFNPLNGNPLRRSVHVTHHWTEHNNATKSALGRLFVVDGSHYFDTSNKVFINNLVGVEAFYYTVEYTWSLFNSEHG